MSRDWTKEKDYNPKDEIVFDKNPLIGLVLARLPKSSLSLYWGGGLGDGGQVFIGRPLIAGGHITRVSHHEFDYAETEKDFRELAQRFVDEANQTVKEHHNG